MSIFEKVDTKQHRYLECSQPNCTKGALSVCKHINKFIEQGEDAKFIRPEAKHYLRLCMTPESHEVFFPRLRGLDLSVFMTGSDLPGGFHEVHLQHPRMVDGTTKVQPLGLLGPGEGRMAVARMAVDWIISQADPGETWNKPLATPCHARSHRYLQQKELFGLFEDVSVDVFRTIKLLVLIAIVLEGACPPCLWSATTDDNYGLDDLQSQGRPDLLKKMRADSNLDESHRVF